MYCTGSALWPVEHVRYGSVTWVSDYLTVSPAKPMWKTKKWITMLQRIQFPSNTRRCIHILSVIVKCRVVYRSISNWIINQCNQFLKNWVNKLIVNEFKKTENCSESALKIVGERVVSFKARTRTNEAEITVPQRKHFNIIYLLFIANR